MIYSVYACVIHDMSLFSFLLVKIFMPRYLALLSQHIDSLDLRPWFQ